MSEKTAEKAPGKAPEKTAERTSEKPAGAHTEFQGLDAPLAAELPSFELFFKTFGFKRVHGRVWGLLVLSGQPLSMREISNCLELSTGATSQTLHELSEWGAIDTHFDPQRRAHVHSPVGNTLSIVATVFRRREQVVLARLKLTAQSTLQYVRTRYGDKDPRVLTLRSILSSCEIADAVMQLVFTSVEKALGDSNSLLHKAVNTALKVGIKVPAKVIGGKDDPRKTQAEIARSILAGMPEDEDDEDEPLPPPRTTSKEASKPAAGRRKKEA